MTRPRWTWTALALLGLLLLRPDSSHRRLRAERARDDPAMPNVLVLIADDHAAWTLGCGGDPRKATPNLDRLAAQGVRFDRAFCNAPVCTASRQSFLTGKLPHANGVTLLPTRLADDAVTLGDWFGGLGYATGAIGKMHFNGPSRHGFGVLVDTPDWRGWLRAHPPEGGDGRRPWRPFQDPAAVWLNAACRSAGLPEASMEATYFADRAAEYFDGHKQEPFALVVSFHEPHSPFVFPREWEGKFQPDQFSVPPVADFDRENQPLIFKDLTPDDVRGISAAYFTSLGYVDHEIGRVLSALEKSGLADNTIVVYWGDNGYLLGQHGRFEKHVLYEPAVRVPLIVRWPNRLPAGTVVDDLVEMVDVFPTLTELCRLPSPPGLQGRSLVPLLEGQAGAKGREVVFSEYLENEEAMARSARYKLIVGTGHRARQDGYITARPTPGPYERLYDLAMDPDEATDVHDRPELAGTVEDLRHQLFERLSSTQAAGKTIPGGLTEIEAIRWSLVPRDEPPPR